MHFFLVVQTHMQMLILGVNLQYGAPYYQHLLHAFRVMSPAIYMFWALHWAGSGITHHGQGHDARHVLLSQADLCLHLLSGSATGRVFHLPGHPAAAHRLWEAFHFQIHLEHPLNSHLRPISMQEKKRAWVNSWLEKKKSVCECRDLCVLVSSFNPVSGLMTTNGKGWWMCLRWISMTFYQLRFSKMPSPFVYDSLFNSLLYGISSRLLYIPLTLYSRWCAM